MKKILFLFAVAGMTVFQSCEGPEGPRGEPGYSAEAEVIEVTNIDFTPNNEFGVFVDFDNPILASDHVLIYRLAATDQGEDVWRQVPEHYFFEDGTLNFSYNFDFTRYDVNLTINGSDLGSLVDEFTQNQIFRIVIVPGSFSLQNARTRVPDYNTLMSTLGLDETDVQKSSATLRR